MGLKKYFWGKSGLVFWTNAVLGAVVLVAVPLLALQALGFYTRHGEEVEVPDLLGKTGYEANRRLDAVGLEALIQDSVYVAGARPGAVLNQTPRKGASVKTGRTVYLTIARSEKAPVRVPDLIRNVTLRIARQELELLGFTLGATRYVEDEPKDLVVGLRQGGRTVNGGDMVSPAHPITVLAGSGYAVDTLGEDALGDFGGDFDIEL